jgi:hypothetical protein
VFGLFSEAEVRSGVANLAYLVCEVAMTVILYVLCTGTGTPSA